MMKTINQLASAYSSDFYDFFKCLKRHLLLFALNLVDFKVQKFVVL